MSGAPLSRAAIVAVDLCHGIAIRVDAGERTTPRGRAAALIACLALAPDHTASRERLVDLLWGGRAPDQARGSLRQCLFELRSLLPDKEWLVADRQRARLSADEIRIDVRQAIDDLRGAIAADAAVAIVKRVTPDSVLAGLNAGPDVHDWALQACATVDRELREATVGCLDRFLSDGDQRAIVAIAGAFAAHHPDDEQIVVAAMRAYAALGETAAAIRGFDQLKRVLARDLDCAPGAEATRLHDAVVSGKAAVAAYLAGTVATLGGGRPSATASTTTEPPDRPLIAVLPFDTGPASRSGQLGDSISDAILSALVRSGAAVIGRHSAFQFRGDRKAAAPQALGASHVVDGRFVEHGDRIELSVRLIESRSGAAIWSEDFAFDHADLAAIEGRIAERLFDALDLRLGSYRHAAATDPLARDLYARAVVGLEQPAREPIEQALAYLKQALARAPDFAPGWAALAEAQRLLMLYLPAPLQQPARADSRLSAERALSLDPSLGSAFGTLANLIPRFGAWLDIDELFERGLAATPSSPALLHLHAQFLLSVGRTSEALDRLFLLRERNPLSAAVAIDFAASLFDVGRVADALEAISQAYALWPGVMLVWSEAVRLHVVADQFERGQALLDAPPMPVAPDDANLARRRLHLIARRGRRPADLAAARKNFLDFARIGIAPAVVAIYALATLDQPEAALSVAEEIFRESPVQAQGLGVSMMGTYMLAGQPETIVLFRRDTAALRDLPGFSAILDRIGLADYWATSRSIPDFRTT